MNERELDAMIERGEVKVTPNGHFEKLENDRVNMAMCEICHSVPVGWTIRDKDGNSRDVCKNCAAVITANEPTTLD